MIKISKPKFPPDIKFKKSGHPHKGKIKWIIATTELLNDFNNDPKPFIDGSYEFNADFGKLGFKDAILKCQGNKCCYCEKPIDKGQLEHFRPKKSYQQNRGKSLNRPGYYWLAYKWENFLVSCNKCNDKGQKGNLFPIIGSRATCPSDNLKTESPIIINPSLEDPKKYITFRMEIPIGIDKEKRGEKNIEIFKLKSRADIKVARSDKFRFYNLQKSISELPGPYKTITAEMIKEAKKYVVDALKSNQPFSGMLNANIKQGLI